MLGISLKPAYDLPLISSCLPWSHRPQNCFVPSFPSLPDPIHVHIHIHTQSELTLKDKLPFGIRSYILGSPQDRWRTLDPYYSIQTQTKGNWKVETQILCPCLLTTPPFLLCWRLSFTHSHSLSLRNTVHLPPWRSLWNVGHQTLHFEFPSPSLTLLSH